MVLPTKLKRKTNTRTTGVLSNTWKTFCSDCRRNIFEHMNSFCFLFDDLRSGMCLEFVLHHFDTYPFFVKTWSFGFTLLYRTRKVNNVLFGLIINKICLNPCCFCEGVALFNLLPWSNFASKMLQNRTKDAPGKANIGPRGTPQRFRNTGRETNTLGSAGPLPNLTTLRPVFEKVSRGFF